ncbi:MAG: hypothetical protein J6N72_08145 [Psychrobacter sp.]|nr:hypothetical protein [Psychrobacter sp.]
MSNTINIKVTLETFLAVCAMNERAKDFSGQGLEAIFDKINETMSNNHDEGAVSVNSWLIAAGEQTSRDLVGSHLHLADDYSEALIDAASSIDFGNEALTTALDNEDGEYDSKTVFRIFKDTLLDNADFIEEAAVILADAAKKAESEHYEQLENGNWMSFS